MGRKRLTSEEKLAQDKKDKAQAKKIRHSGLSPQEIMDAIIDKDALQQRKQVQTKKVPVKVIKDIIHEKKWWEGTINVDDFKIIEHKSLFYAQLPQWKSHIWIGSYKSKEELTNVLMLYCKSTHSKKKRQKEIPNLHSAILHLNAPDKQ